MTRQTVRKKATARVWIDVAGAIEWAVDPHEAPVLTEIHRRLTAMAEGLPGYQEVALRFTPEEWAILSEPIEDMGYTDEFED